MIRVVNVWHHYGVHPVLRDVSLQIETGQVVAVMGPNGMGKSTLLGLMAGLLSPIKGYVEINGRKRRHTVEDEIEIRKQVIYLPDNAYLPLFHTGREFLLAMGRLYGVDDERLMDHVDRLLKLFNLEEQGNAPIRSYSTGQKKKISICSALVTEAPVMILDEPFSGGLDSSGLLALSKILKGLADRQDVTIVMAVPVPELIEPLADKIAVVAHGKIIAYDSPADLRAQTQYRGELGEVLEQLLQPETMKNIENYLERR